MLWKTYQIEKNKRYLSHIGPLTFQVKVVSHDWYLAYDWDPANWDLIEFREIEPEQPETGINWQRWVTDSEALQITLLPVMPDRSLVIRPEIPIHIPQGISGIFYINIPLWLRIAVGNKLPLQLCEVAIQQLSNSWFGDPESGELCYSKKSLVRRNLDELEKTPLHAICEVEIQNNSRAELNFERFALNTENLSVFSDSRLLYTNRVKVIFQGEDQLSQISISKFHSRFEKPLTVLSPARKALDNNIIKKSFQFIKSLTGF